MEEPSDSCPPAQTGRFSSDLFSPDEEASMEEAFCPPARSSCLSSDLFTPHDEASESCTPAGSSRLSSDLFSPHGEAAGSCPPKRALLGEPGDPFASLHVAAYLAPEKIAVVNHGSAAVVTYAQLYARVLRTAAAFLHLGLDKRGRVAVMLANNVAVLDVHFAAAALRAVVVNLNTHLAAPELAFMLQSAMPEVLVIDNTLVSVLTHTLEDSVWGRGSVPCSLRSVLWVGGCPDSASIECLSVLGVSSFAFEDLVLHTEIAPLTLRDLPPRSPDDAYMIYSTSGTSGRPKMVELTHRVVATHARGAVREMRLHASDVWVRTRYGYRDTLALYLPARYPAFFPPAPRGADVPSCGCIRHLCCDARDGAARYHAVVLCC